jgi:hypothetical protein
VIPAPASIPFCRRGKNPAIRPAAMKMRKEKTKAENISRKIYLVRIEEQITRRPNLVQLGCRIKAGRKVQT